MVTFWVPLEKLATFLIHYLVTLIVSASVSSTIFQSAKPVETSLGWAQGERSFDLQKSVVLFWENE